MRRRNRQNRFSYLKLTALLFMLTRLANTDGSGGDGGGDSGGDGGQSGADGQGSDGDQGQGDTGSGSGSGTEGPKTFTEAQVQAMIQDRLKSTNTKHGEKIKALKGDRSDTELAAILAAHDERAEAQKTEAQRAAEAATAREATANEAIATALRETTLAKLTRKLTAPGKDAEDKPLPPVMDDFLDTVLEIALPIALGATEETDAIAYAVAQVRTKAAPMFASPDESTAKGNGSKRPAPGPGRTHGETNDTPGDTVSAYMARQGIKPPDTKS